MKNDIVKVALITLMGFIVLSVIMAPFGRASDQIMAEAEAAYENDPWARLFGFLVCGGPLYTILIIVVALLVFVIYARWRAEKEAGGQSQAE